MLVDGTDQLDLNVKPSGDARIIRLDDRRSLAQYNEQMLNLKASLVLQSGVLPADIPEVDKKNLAMSAAVMAHFYDIEVIAEEAYFIPKEGGGYKIAAGYRGLVKARLRVQERTGKSWVNDNKVNFLSPDEIESRGLHICRRCSGKGGGTTKSNKQWRCYACNERGFYDPKDCLFAEVKMYSVEDALSCQEIGIEYTPMVGSALWQPCDNVAKNRDARWQVTKNAWNDVYRKVFPLTIMGNDNFMVSNLSQDIEDKSTAKIAALCGKYGVEFDDLQSLADFVRKCVYVADWPSEEEVIRGMAELKIGWHIDEEDVNKYKLFGWRSGEYPLVPDVFDSDAPAGAVLLKNVINDLGGVDMANQIALAKLEQKVHAKMSRRDLGEVYNGSIVSEPS